MADWNWGTTSSSSSLFTTAGTYTVTYPVFDAAPSPKKRTAVDLLMADVDEVCRLGRAA